jgi:DNA-binding GntR family transcriptional regulator
MMTVRDETIQRVSMVDNVTARLRRALLSGDIKPGEPIRVAQLEKSLGVSHIREAVRRLEAEGLIVAEPQRAAVAAGVDLEDLGGLYDIRRIIECEVIRRSVARMSDEQVENIRKALHALEAVAPDNDSAEFWDLHMDFHRALLAPGATTWIERVLSQVWLASQRYVRLFVSATIDDAMRDHRELLAACEARDDELAEEILRRHLDRTEAVIRQAFVPTEQSLDRGVKA